MNENQKTPAAAKPSPPDPLAGVVQIRPVSISRDPLSGRPTSVTAGSEPIAEGQPVLCVDSFFRSGCANDGRRLVEQALAAALERFLQSGGRKQFDEIAGQLERLWRDIAIERQLIRGYKDEARRAEEAYAEPADVLRWTDAAAASKRKVEELERQVPILQRQLAAERELLLKILRDCLQSALTAHQSEHFAKAHQIEAQAMSAFLPRYAEALKERIVGQQASQVMLNQTLASVALEEPQRPASEQQPPQIVELPNALAALRS